MKSQIKIKSSFLFLIVTNIMVINSFGQDLTTKNRWKIKLSYANYRSSVRYGDVTNSQVADSLTFGVAKGNFRIESNYYISKYFEAGVYAGILQFETGYNVINGNITTGGPNDRMKLPVYGLNLNIHLLPLFIKKDNLRFELYVTGKFGGINFKTPSYYPVHGSEYEYSIGGGGSIYFTKHVGVFAEYSYGQFSDMKTNNLKLGFLLKF